MCVKSGGKLPDRSPVTASQPLKQVQTTQRKTYDQSAILLVYRILFTELDADSTAHLDGDQDIRTDLILDDGVSGVLCEFAHRMYVRVIFLIPDCVGSLQNGLQLVLDLFKGSVMVLIWELARDVSTKRTRIRSFFV